MVCAPLCYNKPSEAMPRGRRKRRWRDPTANGTSSTVRAFSTPRCKRSEYSAIYRFSARMEGEVDPAALQRAIDRCMPRFPSFCRAHPQGPVLVLSRAEPCVRTVFEGGRLRPLPARPLPRGQRLARALLLLPRAHLRRGLSCAFRRRRGHRFFPHTSCRIPAPDRRGRSRGKRRARPE